MYDGKDLIGMGFKPGKHFQEMIAVANAMEGAPFAQILAALNEIYAEATFEAPTIPLKDKGSFEVLLDPGRNEFERANVEAVIRSMEVLVRTPTVTGLSAVLPDACPAGPEGTIPVGGVVGALNAIHPGMHSSDICCSMFMTVLDMPGEPELASTILDLAQKISHFGVGGRKEFEMGHDHFIAQRAKNNRFMASVQMLQAMSAHYGTQGDGNHFFFVGRLESTGQMAIVTHHGSRKPGALLYKEGMRVAEQFRQKLSPETLKQNAWIPFDTDEGQWYWEALQIIREWTKYNHLLIHDEVTRALNGNGEYINRFWNEHNFVFKKGDMFYHAKGSTPMFDGPADDWLSQDQRIIPLNMGQPILIVNRHEDNRLGFAPHGAGRNMSRTQFMKQNAGKTVERIMKEQVGHIDARFYTGRPDMSELPGAYKDADEVTNQIKKYKLAKISDRVLPLGSMMAGEFDKPWRK